MKNKNMNRRNFLELVLGMTTLPSLALSEERNFNPKLKGWAIQDPLNKQNVRGFIYIPTVWGEQLKPPEPLPFERSGKNYRSLLRANIGLVEAIKKYTDIDANLDSHLYLSSNKLMEYPFLYIATDKTFELTKIERENLEHYLRNGGFAVLESLVSTKYSYSCGESEYSPAEASLKQMTKDVLKKDARFSPIPNSHHLYHCFFDFNDGPPQGTEVNPIRICTEKGWAEINWNDYTFPKPRYYLEGIILDDNLVAVYSGKGYGEKWKEITNNEPQQKMGVNFVVFALTQKSGIVQKDKQ